MHKFLSIVKALMFFSAIAIAHKPLLAECNINRTPLDTILDLIDEKLQATDHQAACSNVTCDTKVRFHIVKSQVDVEILTTYKSNEIGVQTFRLSEQQPGWLCAISLASNPEFFLSIGEETTLNQVVTALSAIDMLSGNIAYKPSIAVPDYFKISPKEIQFTSADTAQRVFERLKDIRVVESTTVFSESVQDEASSKITKPSTEGQYTDLSEFAELTVSERRELALGIQKCWIIPAIKEVETLDLTISMSYDEAGKILPNDILLSDSQSFGASVDEDTVRTAFSAIRRAILRCGLDGYEALKRTAPANLKVTFVHSVPEIVAGDYKKNAGQEFKELDVAIPVFIAEDTGAQDYNQKLTQLIVNDLNSTGLFREIPESAHISRPTNFASLIPFSDWQALNAKALVIGALSVTDDGYMVVKFRVYDVFSNAELGSGLKFSGTVDGWRRMGHKIADVIYTRLTGESGYFDSRIVFVSESGRKGARKKRLAIMDQDGAKVQFLTDSADLVLAPRFSPAGERVLYTSYETGFPQIYMLDIGTVSRRSLRNDEGTMSFAPSFSKDGNFVAFEMMQKDDFAFSPSIRSGTKYIKLVQKLLNLRNCDAGAEDGVAGDKTLKAAVEFAKSVDFIFRGDIYDYHFFDELKKSSVTCDGKALEQIIPSFKSDIGLLDLKSGKARKLTSTPFNEKSPDFSPDGKTIVFASDRSGSSQLYTMSNNGLGLKRISFGSGEYAEPVWSHKGNWIAFSKKSNKGRYHIGIMRPDGSGEKLLTASEFDRAPAWSPNGRVIVFTRETSGADEPRLYTIDIDGHNLRLLLTPYGASEASWSPLGR